MSARARDADFQPNHHLEIAPDFLRAMLSHLRRADIDIVTLDEVHQRLIDRNFSRRFACFTLDDGYRDNRDFALPVMREFDAPCTVYVASDFAEGTGRLWWVALERVIAKAASIEAKIGGVATRLDTSTPAAKQAAFDRLHDWLRGLPGEQTSRAKSARCAPPWRRRNRDLPRTLHVLGRTEAVRRRSAGHDRRAYHHPLQSGQADRGDRRPRDGHQPRPDRKRAAAPGRCISPIPMATSSPPAPANSRWRAPPASRPR